MLMATEGNLAHVRDAFETSPTLREQQRFPYKGWYAVIVRSQREQDAADGFRRENVSAYWPNYQKRVPTARRSNGFQGQRHVFAAIFPGLIFCPTADADLFWAAVQRIPYVLNMLRKAEGVPATLANADIEIIRRIEAGANEPPPITPVHNFKIGEKVRFVDDIMSAWPPGVIVRLYNDGRITVEVHLIGRMVPVVVLPHQIGRM